MQYIGIDIEAKNLKPYGGTIWMLAITRGKKTELIENCFGIAKLRPDIKKELEDKDICKIIHSSQYDGPYIGLVLGCSIRNVWDTQVMELVIQGVRYTMKTKNVQAGSHAEAMLKKYNTQLKYVLPRYGFPTPNKEIRENFINRAPGLKFTKEEKAYAMEDTKYLPAIQKYQEALLKRDGLWELGLLENLVAEKIIQMRTIGIGFDKNIWREIAEKNEAEFNRLMSKLPKEVSNWNSPAQVKKYFFNKGIMIESYDDLPSIYSRTKNKTLGDFIAARELHKAVTSYGLNWFSEDFIDADSRIRCSIDQIIDTGRMSMSNPNLQQLPSKGLHRSAFVSRKGYKFVIGDFSGQEMGIMAAGAGEDIWIDAMLRGEDIHALTASLLYSNEWQRGGEKGCTFPMKCKCPGHTKLREPTKILNFMLAYGGGPQKFAENTGVDMLTAKMIVARYKKVVSKLTKWLEKNGRDALNTGTTFSADPYRRRRVLIGDEDWHIVNQGKNTPIQSAGANMLKLAMVSLPEQFQIVLVIHDEIILEVKNPETAKASKALKKVMEQSADYITGIKGLVRVTPRVSHNLMKD